MADERANAVAGPAGGSAARARDITDELGVAKRPVVPLPHWFGSRPPRAPGFQERKLPLTGTVVLSGPDGVGKSQLAADLAERLWVADRARLVVWVRAGSRSEVVAEYARVATALTGVQHRDADAGAQAFLDRLATAAEPWLVVLDDVRSAADLDGLRPVGPGQLVLTTTLRDPALGPLVDVPVFTPAESVGYLTAVLAAERLAGADQLAEALGYLPLALAQAAAYATHRRITCREYLKRWRKSPMVSVEGANALHPRGLAERLLRIASVLDPDGIPAEVFTTAAVLDYLGPHATIRDVWTGLKNLRLLALVAVDSQVRVHPLVQRAVRRPLSIHEVSELARVAAYALLEVWPEPDGPVGRTLRANAAALERAAGDLLWDGGHRVLLRAAKSLGESGQPGAAATEVQRLAAAAVARWGAHHPDSLVIRSMCANWQGSPREVG